MVDINGPVTEWLLDQLEHISPDSFSGNTLALSEWLFGRVLGEREMKEMHALLSRPPSTQPRVSTVLLPGILGSLLASIRGISATLWYNPTLLLDGHLNLLDLNDDGTGDRSPDVEIVPVGIEKIYYLKLIIALAQETRLYEFPYDWRRHLEWNAKVLHDSIQRWSASDPNRRFVLVGHSMGGMLARTYLALYPREVEERIERVVLIGSPICGVPMAALLFAGGAVHTQIIERLNSSNKALAFAASCPASYQLLPAPPDLYRAGSPYPCDWDLYNAAQWGVPGIRQDYLDDARRFHALLADADPQVEMTQIAGCNKRTLTEIKLSRFDENAPADDPEARAHLTLIHTEDGDRSGDGTVPLYAARNGDMPLYYVEEGHDGLPGNAKVIDAVLSLIQGQTPALPRELPRPSGILQQLNATSLVQQVADLRRRLENGDARRDDLIKLFFLDH